VRGPINIGGEPISIAQVVSELARQAGGAQLLRLGALPARENDVRLLVPDITRLRDEVGFRPKLTLTEGLQKTLAWWDERLRSAERKPETAS
jgi:nucleoside-diphosphate-sugar epimerase